MGFGDDDDAVVEHASDHRLLEVDVVDPVQRDRDAAPTDDSTLVGNPLVGDRELRGLPLDERVDRHHDEHEEGDHRQEPQPVVQPARVGLHHQEQQQQEDDPGDCVLPEVPPVRGRVEDDLFAGHEVDLGASHRAQRSATTLVVRRVEQAPSPPTRAR